MSVEAGGIQGWQRWAHAPFGMSRFGASAPFKEIYEKFGYTVENLTAQASFRVRRCSLGIMCSRGCLRQSSSFVHVVLQFGDRKVIWRELHMLTTLSCTARVRVSLLSFCQAENDSVDQFPQPLTSSFPPPFFHALPLSPQNNIPPSSKPTTFTGLEGGRVLQGEGRGAVPGEAGRPQPCRIPQRTLNIYF